jgi:hypothetical protein
MLLLLLQHGPVHSIRSGAASSAAQQKYVSHYARYSGSLQPIVVSVLQQEIEHTCCLHSVHAVFQIMAFLPCVMPQVLLLEVQSATAIYPATVALLLHALSSAQRQQLADALLDTAQQQQHQQQYLQEPVQQVPAWVQQVHQLSKWDVLLLLGLWGQPQWEADAGLVLLQGVRDMARCAAKMQRQRAVAVVLL